MIEINNLTKFKISSKDIKKKVAKIFKIKKEVSVAFVDSKIIRKLNKNYLGKDQITDVLSFPNFIQEPRGRLMIKLRTRRSVAKAGGSSKISEWHFSNTKDYLGEIIISLPQAKKQAKENGHSFKKEIVRLFVHGLLHLEGFDHYQKKDKQIMMKKENQIIKSLSL